jgi:probable HAF family extracellular repeat protein
MKSRTLTCITAITFFALALPLQLAAQHTQYKLIDLGTFGGPASIIAPTLAGGPENPGRALLNRGVVVGAANTANPDPFSPNCNFPDCFVAHAFSWQEGVLTDLGTLQGVNSDLSSGANWINDRGWMAGFSYTGGIDPEAGGPAQHAVLWRNGEIVDLGTLGEDQSQASALNNRGQVVGFSRNGVPDPVGIFGNTTQSRAFLWQNGVMHDLGTLCQVDGVCGLDAVANAVNESGQVAGISATNATPNATTGVPTVHPFLWERGRMIDLGTLGGTNSGVDGPTVLLNNRGQIAGTSTLEGDMTYHPFLWEHGVMTDLGTLGGDTGFVTFISDSGDVIGTAALSGPPGSQIHHAFLWRNGVKTDLGSLGGGSHAEGVNSKGQIVGRSTPIGSPVRHAFLWENGGPMVDLNTLIPAGSGLLLEEGGNINDRGEIAGRGLPPGCDDVDACGHAFLLIPCDNPASCESKADVASAAKETATFVNKPSTTSTQVPRAPMQILSAWRMRLAQRYPGLARKDW